MFHYCGVDIQNTQSWIKRKKTGNDEEVSAPLIKLQLLYLHHKNCFESVNEVLCCVIFRESRSVSPQQEIHPVSLCQK